jgi:plastocyanin
VFGVLAAIPIVPVLIVGVLMLATQEGRTLPPAVTSLIATDTSYGRNGQIDLAWSPSDAKDFAYYSVYASEAEITDVSGLSPIDRINNNTDVTYQVTKYWANGLSLDLSAFMEDTEYWLAVTTVDLDGNESKLGSSVSVTIEMMPPAPSVFIKVTRDTGNTMQVRGDAGLANIVNAMFLPMTVTVPVGTTISWDSKSERNSTYNIYQHTVTSDTGLFNGELNVNNDIFIYTFTEAGVFGYHCESHIWETGTVIVE